MTTESGEFAAREVEALAKELRRLRHDVDPHAATWREAPACCKEADREAARFVLAREARLVAALDEAIQCAKMQYEMRTGEAAGPSPRGSLFAKLDAILAEHRAATAPSEPTLAEAVEAMLRSAPQTVFGSAPVTNLPLDADGVKLSLVRPAALEAVKAALARERSQVKP